MTTRILIGDVREKLAELEPDSVDCVVTSPPYWGLRSYLPDDHPDKAKEIGLEPTLGEHLSVMIEVFDLVRRAMKPEATLWLNYGDCYATKPNGRSAAATKAAGNDDRTFRDNPFSTVGPINADAAYDPAGGAKGGGFRGNNLGREVCDSHAVPKGRIVAGGTLKPKDLCMIPNRLAIALQDAGWWVRSEIVWGKPNPMPDSSGRYRPSTAHEKLFLLSKSAKCFYDSEAVRMPAASGPEDYKMPDGWDTGDGGHGSVHRLGREKGRPARKREKQRGHSRRHDGFNDRWDGMTKEEQQANGRLLRNYEPDLSAIITPEVWQIATAAFSEAHFATFPPALVAPCILAGCPVGGLVLDPFGGAGTTALVADRLGRNSVLIDLNEGYGEMMERRLRADGGLFAQVDAA